MKLFCAILITIFTFNQTVALAKNTEFALEIVSLGSAEAPSAAIKLIDDNLQQVANAENAENLADANTPTLTPEASKKLERQLRHDRKRVERAARKKARWEARLLRASKKLNKTLHQAVASLDERGVAQKMEQLKNEATASKNTDALAKLEAISKTSLTEQKQSIESLGTAQIEETLPKIASAIAEAGGAVPFLLHAKSQLKELGLAMKKDAKQADRSPARAFFPNKYALMFCIILAVMLVVLCFGIPVTLYCVFLGALLVTGILSVFSKDRPIYI